MISKQKRIFKKFIILNFALLFPLFLPASFLSVNNEVKAGLEIQWDDDPEFKKLKWFQKNNKERARNKIFFFLRKRERKAALLKINMKIPKHFNSTLNEDKVSLCKVIIGGFDSRTKCLQEVPADIELNEENKSLDIFPYNPIPLNKDTYAVVFKIFNPKRSGLYQFHSFGQASGNNFSNYLGSWTIVID